MKTLQNLEPLQILGLIGALFFLTAPITIPLVANDFWVGIVAEIMIWGLFAASANLLFGYTGLLSFGQAVYFGMGAYGVALSIDIFGFSFWPAVLVGIAVATVTAFITGIFAARLTWHYFAIITVVFSLIFFFITVGWYDVTGGDDGLPFTLPPVFKAGGFEVSLLDLTFQYYFILAVVAGCFALMHMLLKSPLGFAFIAVALMIAEFQPMWFIKRIMVLHFWGARGVGQIWMGIQIINAVRTLGSAVGAETGGDSDALITLCVVSGWMIISVGLIMGVMSAFCVRGLVKLESDQEVDAYIQSFDAGGSTVIVHKNITQLDSTIVQSPSTAQFDEKSKEIETEQQLSKNLSTALGISYIVAKSRFGGKDGASAAEKHFMGEQKKLKDLASPTTVTKVKTTAAGDNNGEVSVEKVQL